MNKLKEPLIINCDGAARGNPGPAGIGGVIKDADGNKIIEIKDYIGETTNNIAEYTALIKALHTAKSLSARDIVINLDSELVVKQITGEYKVKNEGLKPLFCEVKNLLANLSYKISHIPREKNKDADILANEAIDSYNSISSFSEPDIPEQGKLF